MGSLEDSICKVFRRATTTIDDQRLPPKDGGAVFIEGKITACPWCGSRNIVIRPQPAGMFAVLAQPDTWPHAVQCLRCHAWGPHSGTSASITCIIGKWNWRHRSWRSYYSGFRRFCHYRLRSLRKERK